MITCLSCSNHGKSPAGNSAYCEDSAMAHFMQTPERAMVLLDSAVIVNELTPQRAAYLKAIVVFNGMEKVDSGIAMCQRLINEKVWEALPDSDDAVSFQVDLYRLMCTMNTSSNNKLAVIRNATEGIKLAHGVKKLVPDESDMLSRMGYMLCQTGQREKGFDAMYRAEKLCSEDDTWSAFLASLNNAKKLYLCLDDAKRYDAARAVVEKALDHLEGLVTNPHKVQHIPEAMLSDSTALMEFVNYYRVPFYSYLVNICCEENNRREAAEWLSRYHELVNTTNYEGSQTIIHPLIVMGRYDEARHVISLVEKHGDAESVSTDRLVLLKNELLLAQLTGDNIGAKTITDKIFEVNDSLSMQSYHAALAEAATQYHLQDEEMKRRDAEARFNYFLIALGVVLLLAVLSISIFRYVKKQNILKKTLSAELEEARRKIESLREAKEKDCQDQQDDSSNLKELYQRAEYIMEHYESYTDPDYDINILAQQIFSNRTYTSTAINQISGMNFRTWIGRYRIAHAKRILIAMPDIKMEDLASQCGFENRVSLYRQFKSLEGMSPLEWLKSKQEEELNNKQ